MGKIVWLGNNVDSGNDIELRIYGIGGYAKMKTSFQNREAWRPE